MSSPALPLRLEPDLAFDASGAAVPTPILVEDGRVTAVGAPADETPAARVPLPGRMLLPGLTNAHSHAFQRALRGRVEARSPSAPEDDFWSWRSRMYACALSVSAEAIELLATWAYADMLKAGFTAVGEFHYLHHAPDGASWGLTSSERLVAAAETVGLRLALLQTAYERAGASGPGQSLPPTEGQRRFVFPDVEVFLAHARAARELDGARLSHGLAIHSVRACSRPWIEAIAAEASAAAIPLHAHACEQPAELEACRAEHGVPPLALLAEAGALGRQTCAVHATHIDDEDVARLAEAEASVCVCPSTERNLGDGLCPIADLHRAGVPLAVGTDSHARIDAADELRSLEDHERMRTLRRSVLEGERPGMGPAVLPAGATGGARALGIEAGGPVVGATADLIAVRTPLEGAASPEAALDAWLVGGSSADVTEAWVAGQAVLTDGAVVGLDEGALRREVRVLLRSLAG